MHPNFLNNFYFSFYIIIYNFEVKCMNKKYLLKNATIYDGTGSNPFKGNVLIVNGKIE